MHYNHRYIPHIYVINTAIKIITRIITTMKNTVFFLTEPEHGAAGWNLLSYETHIAAACDLKVRDRFDCAAGDRLHK